MAGDVLKFPDVYSKGFGMIPKLVMQDRELGIIAKAIYAYFCSYAGGGGGTCFPSRDKICYDLCISKDCFTKHIKQLSDSGYIKVSQKTEHGRFSHNEYTILAEKGAENIDLYEEIPDISTENESEEQTAESKKPKTEKKKSQRFVPPTLEEVKEYVKSINSSIDPEYFYDYYQSVGWKIKNNPIRDWKAKVRNWTQREIEKVQSRGSENYAGNKFGPSTGAGK